MEFKRLQDLKGWSIYFVAKFLLFAQGLVGFHLLGNLGLVLALLLKLESAKAHRIRVLLAGIAAAGLLYVDAYAPVSAADQGQLWQWLYTATLTTALVTFAYYYTCRVIETGIFVLCGFLLVGMKQAGIPLWPEAEREFAQGPAAAAASQSLDQQLQSNLQQFFQLTAQRSHGYNTANTPDFDIVFISICSLAWRDLEVAGLDHHPLLERFDIYFDNFNSATSYSGPALIRLLRADCGQPPHAALFSTQPDRCSMFKNLGGLGFESRLVMNHDGEFGSFLRQLRENGGIEAPLNAQHDLMLAQKSFDGTPIYDDGDTLDKWLWQRARAAGEAPQLMLYNTVSLHDGNRLVNRKNVVGVDGYEFRARRLLDQLQVFMSKLEASNRKTLLVLIPEHGAGLQGDKMQLSGMREIPSPSISHVPVAVKLIGASRRGGEARVTGNSSFFSLSTLIQRIIEADAFGSGGYATEALTTALPVTQPVAQNEGSTVMLFDGIYYVSLDDGQHWTRYPGTR